jgi:hypothetical protein
MQSASENPPPLCFELSGSLPERGRNRLHHFKAGGYEDFFETRGVLFTATAIDVVVDLADIDGVDETAVPGIL